MNINGVTDQYAKAGPERGNETATANILTSVQTVETNTPKDVFVSVDDASVSECWSNYTKSGMYADIADAQPCETDSKNPLEDKKEALPWWLVMTLKKANPNSAWILQMLEEAGIKNLKNFFDTENESEKGFGNTGRAGNNKAPRSQSAGTNPSSIGAGS